MSSGKLYVVVVGCGRLGVLLASRLSGAGHSGVAIDRSPSALLNLGPEFSGFRVTGDATELAVLEEAKVDKADMVIATTRLDTVNLMVTQVALRVLGCPAAMARVFDPQREATYRDLGVETVCPTTLAAAAVFERVTAASGGRTGT